MSKKALSVLIVLFLLFCAHLPLEAQDTTVLRLGVMKYKSEQKVRQTFGPVAEYLSDALGREVALDIVSEEELAWRLHEGTIDLGVMKPFAYLQGKEDFPELEVFASHYTNGHPNYTGLILVREGEGINYLKDLREKNFLFVKPGSTSGYHYPEGIFREQGIPMDSTFFNYGYSYSHQKSLDALRAGEADGIAISTDDFGDLDDMDLSGLRILDQFEVPYHAYVLNPLLPATTARALREALFKADKSVRAETLLNNPLHITGWHPVRDDFYNYLRRYLGLVRVKPQVALTFEVKKSAQDALDAKGDIVALLEENILSALARSGRFERAGNTIDVLHQMPVRVTLSRIGEEKYHYATYLEDRRVGETDLSEKQLLDYLHLAVLNDVLGQSPVRTRLLSTGDRWFITYGHNDGLTAETYDFYLLREGKEQALAVAEINELSTVFIPQGLSGQNLMAIARYRAHNIEEEGIDILEEVTTDRFWQNDFWDKVGLIGGIVVAVISAVFGWYFNNRKKKRFNAMLSQMNSAMKEFLEDQFKFDSNIHELRDKTSNYLESGQITENQYLILQAKLDDMERRINSFQKEDAPHPKGEKKAAAEKKNKKEGEGPEIGEKD